jgi:hypothetical protein
MAPLVNRVFATNPPDDAIPSAPSARPPKILPGRRAARPHIAAAGEDRRSAGGE